MSPTGEEAAKGFDWQKPQCLASSARLGVRSDASWLASAVWHQARRMGRPEAAGQVGDRARPSGWHYHDGSSAGGLWLFNIAHRGRCRNRSKFLAAQTTKKSNFYDDKNTQDQWKAFVENLSIEPGSLEEVCNALTQFFLPAAALARGQ